MFSSYDFLCTCYLSISYASVLNLVGDASRKQQNLVIMFKIGRNMVLFLRLIFILVSSTENIPTRGSDLLVFFPLSWLLKGELYVLLVTSLAATFPQHKYLIHILPFRVHCLCSIHLLQFTLQLCFALQNGSCFIPHK